MASLTTKQRNKLPKNEFALPEQRKYPIDTRARAAGHLSVSAQKQIDAAANRVLKRKK